MSDSSQQFLRDLDKKLWSAADWLRANLDAAVYMHAVLGLFPDQCALAFARGDTIAVSTISPNLSRA